MGMIYLTEEKSETRCLSSSSGNSGLSYCSKAKEQGKNLLLHCKHGMSALLRRRNTKALRGAVRGVPATTPLPIKLLLATILLLMSIEPAISTLDTGRCPRHHWRGLRWRRGDLGRYGY
jgi:hypothetical protein